MVRRPPSSFSEAIKATHLSYSDLEWLSNGVLTPSKLKKHSDGTRLLSAADYTLVMTIIDSHRDAVKGIQLLVLSKVKMQKPVAAQKAQVS
jgi:hypothetical protein